MVVIIVLILGEKGRKNNIEKIGILEKLEISDFGKFWIFEKLEKNKKLILVIYYY